MNIQIGQTALITCDNWFYGPDGLQYRAVFGTVKAIHNDQEALGIRTNAKSTNWYVEIGCMMVAGCQIHYAMRADSVNFGPVIDQNEEKGVVADYELARSRIFNADA